MRDVAVATAVFTTLTRSRAAVSFASLMWRVTLGIATAAMMPTMEIAMMISISVKPARRAILLWMLSSISSPPWCVRIL